MASMLRSRLMRLLGVKSIVTLMLSTVFSYLAVTNRISSHDFLTVFSVIIAFYFGTQSERLNSKVKEAVDEKNTPPQ